MDSEAHAATSRCKWWLTVLLVVLCLALRAGAELAVWQAGFRSLGGDDFSKISNALRWTEKPRLFSSPVWLPLDFWSVGIASFAFPTVYSGAIAVNSFFGALCLVILLLWGREHFGEPAAAIGSVLMAVFPLLVWTSLTPPGEAAFLAFLMLAVLFLFRWRRTGRTGELWGAGLALLAGNSARYHCWMFSVLVALWVIGHLMRQRATGRRAFSSVLAVSLPFAFPALFLLWQWSSYGTAVYFLQDKAAADTRYIAYAPVLGRLVEVPALFVLSGPILAVLSVVGLVIYLRGRAPERWLLLWLAAGYFGLLSLMTIASRTEALYVPHRYALPLVLLLSPLAGALIVRLWRWKLVAIVSLLAVLVWQAIACLRYPTEYLQEYTVARYMNKLWKAGVLGSEDRIVSIDRRGYFSRAVALLSGKPRRFPYMDDMPTRSPAWGKFDQPDDPKTKEWLDKQKIGAVLVVWKDQAPHIEQYLEQYACVAGCKIFVRPGRALPEPPPAEPIRFRRTVVFPFAGEAPLCPGNQLLECVYDRGKFSREVILNWKLDPRGTSNGLILRLDSVIGQQIGRPAGLSINGGFGRPTRAPYEGSDVLDLTTQDAEFAGLYALRLACADEPGRTVELGQFYLMRSKRNVLHQMLRGDFSNWRVALHSLLSLVY